MSTILKAKRIVVLSGAGISVEAGIPDFRSPEGLFQTLKKDNPRDIVASGKDLFDASVFNSEHTTSLFFQMIARLSELSIAAEPTPFHQLLRSLDDRGKLLRVYTQNIDALELKTGLSFGVPEFEDKRYRPRIKAKAQPPEDVCLPTSLKRPPASADNSSITRLPSPPSETPRCIPLHGTLQMLHCQICLHSFPLESHLPSLISGIPPECPECRSMETTRQLVGKRSRGIGRLRPSVVLYNEAHKDGEGVGAVVQKDLIGSSKGKGRNGADLLLVVGTSLRVPGTKRMVREFSKAVHSRATSSSSSTAQSTHQAGSSMKTIYLNMDFPVPSREWEGVFDVWVQGDAQKFADLLQAEIQREAKAKEAVEEKKRKREVEDETMSATTPPKKRKPDVAQSPKSRKPTKPSVPPTPPWGSTPSPSQRHSRLTIRIPNTTKLRRAPEVVITSPPRPFVFSSTNPPTTPTKSTSQFSAGRPPPTPEKSPPPSYLNRLSPSKLNFDFRHDSLPILGSRLAVSFLRTQNTRALDDDDDSD